MIGLCLCAVLARAQEGDGAAEVPPLPEVLDFPSLDAEWHRLEAWRLESSVADPEVLDRVLALLAVRDESIRFALAESESKITALASDAPGGARAELEGQRRAWTVLAVKSLATRADCDERAESEQRLQWAGDSDALATSLGPRYEAERALARYTLAELSCELGDAAGGLELVLELLDELRVESPDQVGLSILAADTERRLGLHAEAMDRAQRALDAVAQIEPDPATGGAELIDLELGCFSVLASCQLELGLVDRASLCVTEMGSRVEALRALPVPPAVSIRQAVLRTANLLQALERDGEVVELVERWLADDLVCGDSPATRWSFELARANARVELERRPGAKQPSARAELEALAHAPYGSETNRFVLELCLAEVEYEDGRLEEASRWLDRAEDRLEEWGLADQLGEAMNPRIHLAWLRVRTLLASGAPHEQIAAERDVLAEEIEKLLSVFTAFPSRSAGLGFLYLRRRRAWFAAYTEASIELDGEEKGASRALDALVSAQRVGTLARSIGGQAASLEEMRQVLVPQDGGILVYLPALARGHVFALDRERVAHAELPEEAELAPVLEDFEQSFQELLHATPAPSREMLAREHDLALRTSELLLPHEIADRVRGWKSLTIVGADLLGETPLEFLVLDDEPLALSHAVAFLPSLVLGVALQTREALRTGTDGECLLVAVAHGFDPSLGVPELPFGEDDLLSLLEPYGTRESWKPNRGLWIDERATRRALTEADLGTATMAQLLVHGTSDPARERPALLCLAAEGTDPGALSCEDVEALATDPAGPPAAPAFVLLTACGTARGPWRPGDDSSSHMGGAWLRAGARAVALTSTDLQASEALELSRAMHIELARGASPARALQLARRALVADRRAGALHAAGLVRIVGLGHDALFPARVAESSSRSPLGVAIWIATGVAVACIAVAALSRRARGNAVVAPPG